MQSVIGLFERTEKAEQARQQLDDAGFRADDVTTVKNLSALWPQMGCRPANYLVKDIGIGIGYGILGAGLFGVVAAVGQLSLGFGPAVAIETLGAFVLAWGILIGGLLGLFVGAGEAEQETRRFMRGILGGGIVVAVRAKDEEIVRARAILAQANAAAVKVCGRRDAHQPQTSGAHPTHDQLTAWTRRIARGLGSLLLAVVLLFLIGEGIFGIEPLNPLQLNPMQDFMLLALIMTLLGIIVAWFWEGIGGLLIVGSTLLFAGINAISSGYWRFGVLDPFFLLTGLLFLFNWWRTVGADLDQNSARTA